MNTPLNYRERTTASPLFRVGIAALLLVTAVASAAIALTEDAPWAALAAALLLVGVVVILDRWFMVLDVRVDADGATLRFGPFSHRLPAGDIQEVRPEPYQWMSYGGWGIRWATGKRRAWSVPFLSTGVDVALKDGGRYFISSRSPERLCSAIVEATERRRGTRG